MSVSKLVPTSQYWQNNMTPKQHKNSLLTIQEQFAMKLGNDSNEMKLFNELLLSQLDKSGQAKFINDSFAKGLVADPISELHAYDVLCPFSFKARYLVAAKTKKEVAVILDCSPAHVSNKGNKLSRHHKDAILALNNPDTLYYSENNKANWVIKRQKVTV